MKLNKSYKEFFIAMRYLRQVKSAIKHFFTLDRRVVFSLLFRASQALVGVVTVLMIGCVFNPEEQGYYYTFSGILALQIIFEMGLSFTILQFAGHEFAVISWSSQQKIEGPPEKVALFGGFLAKCAIAYGLIALAIFVIVWPVGILFFTTADHHSFVISWGLPWFCLCITTAANVFTFPFLSVIEGSGHIAQINQFKIIRNTAAAFCMWIAMLGGANLYSIAFDPLIRFVIGVLWIKINYPDLIAKTYLGFRHMHPKNSIQLLQPLRWMDEVWPMQWRIAISWISGYFVNQLYAPIVFYYHDAASAGRLGASMMVCNLLSLFATTFLTAYNPEMCQLIANKKWQLLYSLFKRVFLHALFLSIIAAGLILAAMFLPFLAFIAHRFVSPLEMLLLLTGALLNYLIGAIALFLRAFKREPFVWVSLISSIFNVCLAWWFGRLYGTVGVVSIFLLVNLFFGLPAAWFLWRKNTVHLWTDNLAWENS